MHDRSAPRLSRGPACPKWHALISHNRKHYDEIPGLVLISETPKILKGQIQIKDVMARIHAGFAAETMTKLVDDFEM
jgi:hypothetical protein